MSDIPKKSNTNPRNPNTGKLYKLPPYYCGRNKGLEQLAKYVTDILISAEEHEWQIRGEYDSDIINKLIDDLDKLIPDED